MLYGNPPNEPCEGLEVMDHVSVALVEASLIARFELMEVADASSHSVSDVEPVKAGVVANAKSVLLKVTEEPEETVVQFDGFRIAAL